MDFLLITLGSHGDVHPFVGLGIRLRQRGHRVRLATNEYFGPLVRGAGLDFIKLGDAEVYLSMAKNPDMWKSTRGFKAVFAMVGDSLREVYDTVAENLTPDTVVASSSLCLGVRVAEDKLGFGHATVHLSPSIFRTIYDVPKLPMLFMPRWLPLWVKRGMWDFGDNWIVDPVVAPPLNRLRSELGLPPLRHVLRDWWHAPRLTVGMFPDWFGPPQPDWPGQVRLTGFPLYDETGITPLPGHLEDFLARGEPPVAFTPGSAMFDGAAYFRAAVDACVRLKIRGILLTRHREQVPTDLPDNVIHVEYAPFSLLLPRLAAVAHHAGIGSSAQSLAAGVPTLAVPMCHDQLDNAERLRRLGVAEVLPSPKFVAGGAGAALRRLLDSDQIRENARAVAAQFVGADGLGQTCDLLESLAPAHEGTRAPGTSAPVAAPLTR